MVLEKVFEKGNISVLIGTGGQRGISTLEKIDGTRTYFEWDDRYGETYKDQIRNDGFGTFIGMGGWRKAGFPETAERRKEFYAAVHLFTLLDYCKEKGIKFKSSSNLNQTIEHAWKQGLKDIIKREEVGGYLGILAENRPQ